MATIVLEKSERGLISIILDKRRVNQKKELTIDHTFVCPDNDGNDLDNIFEKLREGDRIKLVIPD